MAAKKQEKISAVMPLSEADSMLLRIRNAADSAKRIEEEFSAEMEVLKQIYALRIETAKQTLAILEADLTAFLKANKTALFSQADTRLDLQNGSLIYTVEKRVKRIRDMLTRLENANRVELIKTVKSVDWDSVEKLTDAELKVLGTERKPKDIFSYEIKE